MTHEVRPLAEGEHPGAVAVCARAFWPDPLLGFFSRDRLDEYKRIAGFFDADIRDRRGYSETNVVDHEDRLGALAMWCPPGSLPRPAGEQFLTMLRSVGLLARSVNRRKALKLLNHTDEVRPSDCWYLALLATDPSARGRGLGSALLAPRLAECDARGETIYLETQKASNVAWYARHGFEQTGLVDFDGCPNVWLLTRRPR